MVLREDGEVHIKERERDKGRWGRKQLREIRMPRVQVYLLAFCRANRGGRGGGGRG